MHNLLTKLFVKKGIKDITQLDKEEKAIFDNYERILSKKQLDIEDIKKFVEGQIGIIEARWRDLAVEESKKSALVPYHTVYKTILLAISAPEVERANLENYLIQLIS